MYRVIVERSAEKDLQRLSLEIRARATTAILALAKNPRPTGSRKLAGTENDWRIRVGDYRIITKSPTKSASFASTVCVTDAMFTGEDLLPRSYHEVLNRHRSG